MKLLIFAYVLEFPKCFSLVFLFDCYFCEADRNRYEHSYPSDKETDIEVRGEKKVLGKYI